MQQETAFRYSISVKILANFGLDGGLRQTTAQNEYGSQTLIRY